MARSGSSAGSSSAWRSHGAVVKRAPCAASRRSAASRIAGEPSSPTTTASGCAARTASESSPSPQQRSITVDAPSSRGTSAASSAICRSRSGT